MVRLDGLRAALCAAAYCSAAHAIRQGNLWHDPPKAAQDRRAGAHQRAAHQIRDVLGLPLPARLRPCPRTTDQRCGKLTKQRKPAIIFDIANRSTTTASAQTRGGCEP